MKIRFGISGSELKRGGEYGFTGEKRICWSIVPHDRRERARDLLGRLESLVRLVSLVSLVRRVLLSELALPIEPVSMGGWIKIKGTKGTGKETYSNWCNSRNSSTSLDKSRNSSRHDPCVSSIPDTMRAHRARARWPLDHPIWTSSSRHRRHGFQRRVEFQTKYAPVCRHGSIGRRVAFVCRLRGMQARHSTHRGSTCKRILVARAQHPQ